MDEVHFVRSRKNTFTFRPKFGVIVPDIDFTEYNRQRSEKVYSVFGPLPARFGCVGTLIIKCGTVRFGPVPTCSVLWCTNNSSSGLGVRPRSTYLSERYWRGTIWKGLTHESQGRLH